jgi:hypothetical protein
MWKVALVLILVSACGDGGKGKPDAGVKLDGKAADAAIDGALDAPPDAPQLTDGIAEARMAGDLTGLSLPITGVTVTYIKPPIGNLMNDPAGFTIQAQTAGPALFIAVDPSTLTPAIAVGDVVSFTITGMTTVGMQRRALSITNYSRVSTGANVAALAKDVSAATDLVTNPDNYDSEVVNIIGAAFEQFVTSGQGFVKSGLSTAGISSNVNLQLRVPATLADSLDLTMGCTISAHQVPVGRFNAQVQIGVFSASDIALSGCPAPTITSAVAVSSTSVRITLSRNILASTVMTDGSQFTFDNGLTASAATVSGRTVTLTTTAQTPGMTYTLTIANTVTDLQASTLANNMTTFTGFVTLALVRINEVNANLTSSCDLIELRVIQGGSMAGFKLNERAGSASNSEMSFTFPAGFTVATNDFIIVHTTGTVATCNPGGATAETTTKTDQPVATYAGNFDNAFDFWVTDNGLTNTDNVFTLFDSTNAIVDALFVSDDPAGATAAAGTETAAAAVGVANQWSPAMTTYIDTVFRTNAADDLNATGTTQAGNSIQRVNDADTNAKADWTTGAGAASTWGALNPGQTAL